MASLKEISEIVHRQVEAISDESRYTIEEVIVAAKLEFAWQTLQKAWKDKREEGEYIIDARLLKEEELTIVNNRADISKLNILKALPSEMWLQNIGGLTCKCEYIKTDVNLAQLLCDDDATSEYKKYLVIGNNIIFPKGAHSDKLPIIYASDGTDMDEDDLNIDEAIGALVRQALLASYLGKRTEEDKTNNSNSNT